MKLRTLFSALILTLAAVAVANAQEHPGGNPGDLSQSCQVSAASRSVNGLAVRAKVDKVTNPAQGAPLVVPAGTRGCAYDLVDGKVVVFMPVITSGGVTPFDVTYLPSELTGAN